MIHHVTYEIDKKMLVRELEFWALLGFCPAAFGPRRRSRKQPIIHWLVGGDHSHAVELLAVEGPRTWGLGHVALSLPQRRWEIATKTARDFDFLVEPCPQHGNPFGQHAFFHSPSGHVIEVFTNKVARNYGPPLEEES